MFDMKKFSRIYLDNASTTPLEPAVLSAMRPYLEVNYGNPSSMHREGRLARQGIEEARERIAKILGAEDKEIIFTSGGTESDNLAILGLARANKHKGKHIITSVIEHKAVLDSCKQLEKEGFEVTYLGVDKAGQVNLKQLESNLRPDTILVSIMYANNEIGSIQPIRKISKIIKQSKISRPIFHSDACQAVGALPIKIKELGADALTFSASKIYGPKGSGCLYVNKNIKIKSIIFGGGQESGIRSGTENTANIVGLAEALVISEKKMIAESKRLQKLQDYFLTKVMKKIEGVTVNGSLKNRLPNNINIAIRGAEGESLVLLLDALGVACSTGSACSAMDLNPSYVLTSIGTPVELAHCSVRFTLGRQTQKKDLDYTVKAFAECVEKIRKMSVKI